MKLFLYLAILVCSVKYSLAQSPVSASFIATLGSDTVIVETYNRVANHLFGIQLFEIIKTIVFINAKSNDEDDSLIIMEPVSQFLPVHNWSKSIFHSKISLTH